MRSKELAYSDDTTTFLVAGRQLYSDVSYDELFEISDSIDELAKEIGRPLVALPAGWVASEDFDNCTTSGMVVGILAAQVENGYDDSVVPSLVVRDDLLAAVEQAAALPWAEISDLFTDPQWGSEEAELHVMACGPLAGGWVAYGVLVDLAEPAGTVPGLELVSGTLMDQRRQPKGVHGVRLVGTGFEGEPNEVDLSAEPHEARVAALGTLADQSAYYLISHYD